MDHKVELLAPAGNMDGFFGAIHAGADAVYLGGKRFGARAYADNFSEEELLFCIRYAHIWGRKVYLTVNTLVKETEFDQLEPFLEPLYAGGLDGVIVQDLGVFAWIRRNFPELGLHVSTQMTVTGSYGAALLKRMGASRIVPARELDLSEIEQIRLETGIEIETFIHGAMCYCYSGQCLFSSILGGRSGNRGRCAQSCRLPYRVERAGEITNDCYPLSLKDLCTIEVIPRLIRAGIDSFKIEGRMKKPEYAAGVTAVYRRCVDRCSAQEDKSDVGGTLGTFAKGSERAELASLYIRSERQNGYYFRHNGRDMVTLCDPSYSGTDEELLARIRAEYIDLRPAMDIRAQADFRTDRPAKVVFTLEIPTAAVPGGQAKVLEVCVLGETVQRAQKQPVTKENIEKQLGKLGDTSFRIEEFEITLDEDAFYPLKGINELRRRAVVQLEDALIEANGFRIERFLGKRSCGSPVQTAEQDTDRWHVCVQTAEQLAAAESFVPDIVRIYLEADLLTDVPKEQEQDFWERCHRLGAADCELVIALPYIIRKRDAKWLEELWAVYRAHEGLFAGFLARSVDGLGFLYEQGFRGAEPAVYGDAGLYVWNREAMRGMHKLTEDFGLSGFCMPYELKAAEQRRLLDEGCIPCEKVVYGRIPLMVTANCVANTVDGCRGDLTGRTEYALIDRYQKRFPVSVNCRHCMNIIYNSVPLSLHAQISKWRGRLGLRLNFTIESGEETFAVLQYFMGGAGEKPPYGEYTTGHEKRGTE